MSEAGQGELLPCVDSDRFLIASWAELFHKFIQYAWPGNVRQLSNFAQQVALVSDRALQLPLELQRQLRDKEPRAQPDEVVEPTPNRSRADIGEDAFLEIMANAGYEPARASRLSGIPRTTIYRLIESSTILQTASQVPEGQLVEVLSSCGGDIRRAATQLQVSMPGLRSRLRTAAKIGR
jgi:two-component system nitrogen regulation response regulator GlnG